MKAFLALVLSAPILTEVASASTPVHALLDPRVDLFLLMAYSLPLLVIRELVLRWRLSSLGVFVIGLAYGIWNEGLLAQTLLRFQHVPIGTFDHYICAAGFNFSWAGLILPWHASFAITFPLALLAGFFPGSEQDTWLGKRVFAALAAILIALILCISTVRKPHPQMLSCFFALSGLVLISYFLRREQGFESRKSRRAVFSFLFGAVASPAFIIGAILLAKNRAPALVYFTFIVAGLAGLAILCRRYSLLHPPASTRLAIGSYFAISLFTMATGIARHSLEQIMTGGLLAAIFLFLVSAGLRRLAVDAAER